MKILNLFRKLCGTNAKYYYKVVSNEGGKLKSAAMCGPPSVRYCCDRWTRPVFGNGPLCVFKTLESATEFAIMLQPIADRTDKTPVFEVWICEVKNSPWFTASVWYLDRYSKHTLSLANLYKETKLVSAVKLLEQVRCFGAPRQVD